MKPWDHLDTATTPDGGKLELWRHDADFSIRAEGYDLMVSRAHHSEDVMMSLACPDPPSDACVLIGGLGMGYTLRGTLDLLPPGGTAVVSELIPKVVEWNRGVLGELAGHPLDDPRTVVAEQDVVDVIRESTNRFDAILLDVDNGPDAYTQEGNERLYTAEGLARIHRALRPRGVVAVWAAGQDSGRFERSLRKAGFTPRMYRVTAHGARGRKHVVYVGTKN